MQRRVCEAHLGLDTQGAHRAAAEHSARQGALSSIIIGAGTLPPEGRSLPKRKLTQMEALEGHCPQLGEQGLQQTAGGDSLGDVVRDDLPQDEGLRHRVICRNKYGDREAESR